MPAYKDNRQGTWYASFYFENWQGVKQKKLKRGFATKKDALAWEREFLLQQAADLTMTFEAFVEIYEKCLAGGDIVVFKKHIGIISDKRNRKGICFVIHHANPYQIYYEEDILEHRDDIIGHYRIS